MYRWVNIINGKTYVGSAKDLGSRLRKYYNLKVITEKSPNMLIHKALIKYSYENFSL